MIIISVHHIHNIVMVDVERSLDYNVTGRHEHILWIILPTAKGITFALKVGFWSYGISRFIPDNLMHVISNLVGYAVSVDNADTMDSDIAVRPEAHIAICLYHIFVGCTIFRFQLSVRCRLHFCRSINGNDLPSFTVADTKRTAAAVKRIQAIAL